METIARDHKNLILAKFCIEQSLVYTRKGRALIQVLPTPNAYTKPIVTNRIWSMHLGLEVTE